MANKKTQREKEKEAFETAKQEETDRLKTEAQESEEWKEHAKIEAAKERGRRAAQPTDKTKLLKSAINTTVKILKMGAKAINKLMKQ